MLFSSELGGAAFAEKTHVAPGLYQTTYVAIAFPIRRPDLF
jgi:hypothetical protein